MLRYCNTTVIFYSHLGSTIYQLQFSCPRNIRPKVPRRGRKRSREDKREVRFSDAKINEKKNLMPTSTRGLYEMQSIYSISITLAYEVLEFLLSIVGSNNTLIHSSASSQHICKSSYGKYPKVTSC